MIQFLNQPYPLQYSSKKSLWIITGTSLFVSFFLFLFKPFGLYVFVGPNFFIMCLQFGLVTGVVMAAGYFLVIPSFPELFIEENWTVYKHIIWVSSLFVSIAAGNTIFMYLIDLRSFSWTTLINSLLQVTALGVIISALIVSLDYLRHFKSNQNEIKKLKFREYKTAHPDEVIHLAAENKKEQLRLNADELLYLTTADNYVEVFYKINNNTSKKLLRGTLQRMENQLDHPAIIRCHRSYIVNLLQVVTITGNAQGFQLTLRDVEKMIPVSRSYKKDVMNILKSG